MSTVESLKDAGRVTWKWIKRLILLTILVFISYFLFELLALRRYLGFLLTIVKELEPDLLLKLVKEVMCLKLLKVS